MRLFAKREGRRPLSRSLDRSYSNMEQYIPLWLIIIYKLKVFYHIVGAGRIARMVHFVKGFAGVDRLFHLVDNLRSSGIPVNIFVTRY